MDAFGLHLRREAVTLPGMHHAQLPVPEGREEALRAYQLARENVPPDDRISELLTRQIERVTTEPLKEILPLRNPEVE